MESQSVSNGLVLDFMKTLYNEEANFEFSEAEYEQIGSDLDEYSLAGMAYYMLRDSDRWLTLPAQLRSKLGSEFEYLVQQNFVIKVETERILNIFEKEGIEVIPLKGIPYSERFYGHFAVRGTGDIDLLIRQSSLPHAVRVLEELGYHFIEKDNRGYHEVYYRVVSDGSIPLLVELHWSIDNPRLSEIRVEDFWDSALPIKNFQYIKQFNDLHTLYFICLHSMKHFMLSPRYIIDIAHLLHKSGEDFNIQQLLALSRKHHTSKRINAALSIVYDIFPDLFRSLKFNRRPYKIKPYYDVGTSNEKPYKLFLYRHMFSMQVYENWKQRFTYIIEFFIPPVSRITHLLAGYKVKSLWSAYLNYYQQRWKNRIVLKRK
ncbi:nucleotidyltransferase family protein [Paenibacillus sp. Soil787]|uniref:nucleotidyltransferase domain-containing protein n=1 Tax=Paenibacillus sp. Soil787 TaxID=1736411 RepID=UPI0006F549DB|nr:nucleotidyltransferase family protein [Paenibacillus sp. Soil787]KRF35882.1 hypothetical protein ASG93_25705 [Paenibacillus sp. Soil787]